MQPWDIFFRQKMEKIFTEKRVVIDIGGGLRIDPKKNNRARGADAVWLTPLVERTEYRVLDKVADYHPDIVGDIHALPFADNSIDAVICIAVLESVENPIQAMREVHRVLKPGGYCFIYVPFLYYFHPLKGYYKDFYRFTHDGVEYLMRDFKTVEIQNIRGAVETVFNLFPFFSKRSGAFGFLDRMLGKEKSHETSGYNAFGVK